MFLLSQQFKYIVISLFFLTLGCSVEDFDAIPDQDGSAPRIITLAPHLAELIDLIGAKETLVGVSTYTNVLSEDGAKLPYVGDAFLLDLERIAFLNPTIILAWQAGTPNHIVEELQNLGYRVEKIKTNSLNDIETAVTQVGKLTGYSINAEKIASEYHKDLQRLSSDYSKKESIRVFYQISERPLHTVNKKHYVTELIELCGGDNIFNDLNELAPLVSEEAVIVRNPEVFLAGRSEHTENSLENWQKWPEIMANIFSNYFYINANDISRPTPGLIAVGEVICKHLKKARFNRSENIKKNEMEM